MKQTSQDKTKQALKFIYLSVDPFHLLNLTPCFSLDPPSYHKRVFRANPEFPSIWMEYHTKKRRDNEKKTARVW